MPKTSQYKSVSVSKDTYEKLLLMADFEKRNLSQQLSLLIDVELDRLTSPLADKKDDFNIHKGTRTTKNRYARRALDKSKNVRSSLNKKEDFDVLQAVKATKERYVRRALEKSKNVSCASKLLGLKNYQTLQNWMRELEI